MKKFVCIHGHFYQPPRENPWLEAVELQDSSYPFHDWNERITAECYAPNTASRILDQKKRIIDIVNNYKNISFNFGPTLLSWMEKHRPEVYQAILQADVESQKQFSGHGSAIAQVYNHLIMPLASKRDKITQVKWGIRDFEYRFKRKPESMWLPETGVDIETLEILSEHGFSYIILSPYQALRVRKKGEKKWQEVRGGKIDPRRSYLVKLPSGKEIVVFFYDGHISNELGFGGLLNDGEGFAKRLVGSFAEDQQESQLVHAATDGESYGHHHRHGDMALAYCQHFISSQGLAEITIYGEYLEKYPPEYEVEILENSSWSCAHGVERWRSNCGCSSGMHPEWSQEWRAPLRQAMDWLRDNLSTIYEKETENYLKDPWQVRDEYINVVLDRSRPTMESFFQSHAEHDLSLQERVKILKLMEMQRHAMLMYTSCGWFFDELSGIETIQIMQYADRAMQLAREINNTDLEKDFLEILVAAKSNLPHLENGARVYELYVKPGRVDLPRVGAHYSISSLFEEYPEKINIYCYTAESLQYEKIEAGRLKLALGQARITSQIVKEETTVSFATLHLGDHNINGGVKEFMSEEAFNNMYADIKGAFSSSDIPGIIRLMDKHFGMNNYSLRHLFRDEQRKVIDQILKPSLDEIEENFRQVYQTHYPFIQAIADMNLPLPELFFITGQSIANAELKNLLESDNIDLENIHKIIGEIKKFSFKMDSQGMGYVASKRVNVIMENLLKNPEELPLLQNTVELLQTISQLPLELDLRIAQNLYFQICKKMKGGSGGIEEGGTEYVKNWVELFNRLGEILNVKCE